MYLIINKTIPNSFKFDAYYNLISTHLNYFIININEIFTIYLCIILYDDNAVIS